MPITGKMRKKWNKKWNVIRGMCVHLQLGIKPPLDQLSCTARRKWVCPFALYLCNIAVSNSYWSKIAEIKPTLEASSGITEYVWRHHIWEGEALNLNVSRYLWKTLEIQLKAWVWMLIFTENSNTQVSKSQLRWVSNYSTYPVRTKCPSGNRLKAAAEGYDS